MFQELSIYRNDLIKLFTRKGYGESNLENILASSGALILVKKSRKKLNFGSVDLEMCILEITCASNVSKWSSVCDSQSAGDDLSLLPVISGYPMWVQAVDSTAMDPIVKQSLVYDSMSRLSSLEFFLSDEGKGI